jgi:hypothetical protein
MIINKQWTRIFKEEAGNDGEAGGGEQPAEQVSDQPNEQVNDSPSAAVEQPEWLQSKYITDGKSQEESIAEQAKAYNELSGKFGSFTGAPESYDLAFSDELKEAGLELNADDPMIEAATEFAKSAGMNQEGFDQMLNLYGMQKLADSKAQQEDNDAFAADQMKILGANAESRIQNINEWANKHLDAEDIQGIQAMTTTAESVKAVERIIAMTRGASVDVDNSQSNSGASAEDVSKMQFEKDGHGNRRINTDPEFRARYQKLRNEVYGTEDHKQVVGG